jgi:hypothetical protein
VRRRRGMALARGPIEAGRCDAGRPLEPLTDRGRAARSRRTQSRGLHTRENTLRSGSCRQA